MIFGKYQLLELLGRGGMAEVFKAKSYGVEGFEKLLVIKRILPTLTDNELFVNMFIDEAKISVSLNHANIVQVFDLGKVGDSYYMAMEFVQGFDMSTIIKRTVENGRAIPAELAAYIASEVAKGLDYAHRRRGQNLEPLNIIHRDISPHNILISFEGEVKITDFGIAKAKTTLTQEKAGTVKGKFAYMAPEQAQGKPHDRRVDIYALGICLYEAISGTNPFRGLKAADVIHKVKTKNYPPIRDTEYGQDASTEICEIISKATEANATARFKDSGELYEALISSLYSAKARVGAHTVSEFIDGLKKQEEIKSADINKDAQQLFDALEDGASASTSRSSVTSEETDIQANSEVTSVQVPTQVNNEQTSTTTTTTGTTTLSAELRDVTVIAVEMLGPTPPAKIISRLTEVIRNDGGSLIEERNDLLVAFFGLEAADGRDTHDGINSALKLHRALLFGEEQESKYQLGIGVHSDNIIITSDGKPREGDAFFKAVKSARELAKHGIDWVCTSKDAQKLVSDSFYFEDIITAPIAGTVPVVCKVLGRRPIADTYGKLFGRREELRTIGEILATVSRNTGKILSITGEAGTGKTRILHEVNRRLLAGGHEVGWHEATCVPWRNSTPFSGIATMFRSILAVGEIENELELKIKLGRLRELGLIPEEIDAVSVLMGAAAECEASPEERSRQLRSALIRAASSLSADKITIFFWDDLNYIDQESLDILKHLGKSISHLPLLLAVAMRPGFHHAWANEEMLFELELGPLSESESKQLTLSRLGVKKAPEDLLIDVALKSDGSPLYIEEYIKALTANEIVSVNKGTISYNAEASLTDLPKTLRGLVSARVNRLPITQKGLLQRVAVMGQRFNINLLSRVTGVSKADLRPTLQNLKEVGLLNRISASEFAFVSDLIRDVVYQGIILSDRKEIHASIAAAIEDMFEDRLDEFTERLATHYGESGDRAKAVDFLILAGKKVAAEYSHQIALDYYLEARELLQNVPSPDLPRILSLYILIGELTIKTNQAEMGVDKMRIAEELAAELADKRAQIQIMRIAAVLHSRIDNYAESQQYFQRAIQLSDELGDATLRCKVRTTAGNVHVLIGDMKQAIPYFKEAAALFEEIGDKNLQISSMAQMAKTQSHAGDTETALQTIKEARALLDPAIPPETHCILERAHSMVAYICKDTELSLTLSIKALDIAREYDLKEQITANAHNIGDIYLTMGDYRKAFSYLRMSQEAAKKIGFDLVANLNHIFLSFLDALKFGSNEGLSQLEQALIAANERNTVWEQVQVHYFLGRIYFERKKYDISRSHLEQALRIGRAADNKIYDAQALDLLEQVAELENRS